MERFSISLCQHKSWSLIKNAAKGRTSTLWTGTCLKLSTVQQLGDEQPALLASHFKIGYECNNSLNLIMWLRVRRMYDSGLLLICYRYDTFNALLCVGVVLPVRCCSCSWWISACTVSRYHMDVPILDSFRIRYMCISDVDDFPFLSFDTHAIPSWT